MSAFERVFRRFRWLSLLFALLACLPPQITILAPVLPETALSASGEIQQQQGSTAVVSHALPVIPVYNSHTQDELDSALVLPVPDRAADLLPVFRLLDQEREGPVNSEPGSGTTALLDNLTNSEEVLPSSWPLRLTFPEPEPPLTSAWRPPLYPVPWAKSPQDHFYFTRPIAAGDTDTSLGDYRYGGMFFEDVVHTGIDFIARVGTPVMAAGSGKVAWAGSGLFRGVKSADDPYGLAVAILHDFGYQGEYMYTVYGHLDQVNVTYGQLVQAGDIIGLSGETGKVTGPHLHFEVRIGKNGFFSTRNPELWLAPPQGWGILAGRVMNTGGLLVAGQQVTVASLSSSLTRSAKSYGLDSVNSDPYYQENIVISDLPAGIYEIRIAYAGVLRKQQVEIIPGLVSYFTFQGFRSFGPADPPSTQTEFTFPP
jgi:murein DD-endopeptidase MepM/ murein hydrolase activator NlpD